MTKLLTMTGATIFGYLGWFLGEPLGFLAAFLISGVGSMVGVYVGWKLAQKFQ